MNTVRAILFALDGIGVGLSWHVVRCPATSKRSWWLAAALLLFFALVFVNDLRLLAGHEAWLVFTDPFRPLMLRSILIAGLGFALWRHNGDHKTLQGRARR